MLTRTTPTGKTISAIEPDEAAELRESVTPGYLRDGTPGETTETRQRERTLPRESSGTGSCRRQRID